jgi:uncharacterized protein
VNARWAAAVLTTALLVWFSAPGLPWPARLWTTALLAGLPALMIVQARQLRELAELPRQAAYVSSIASLWLLAAATVFVARAAGFRPAHLGFHGVDPAAALAWIGALTAAGIGVVLAFHLAGYREGLLVRQLMPETGTDRVLFLGVSLTAGICEEIVFRGFLLYALTIATGGLPLALLLSSAIFGVVHAYQQPLGALRAALIGALLALPLVLGGSIIPAIIAHVLIDVITGFWLARYLH